MIIFPIFVKLCSYAFHASPHDAQDFLGKAQGRLPGSEKLEAKSKDQYYERNLGTDDAAADLAHI